MATTIKNRGFAFTEDMEKQLEFIREELGESSSQIMKKALFIMYQQVKNEAKENNT